MTNPRFALILACHFAAATTGARAEIDVGAAERPDAAEGVVLAAIAPKARPVEVRHCTGDQGICISAASYVSDVCGAIERSAQVSGLDPNFFVRLIWRESLFDAGAVSPAGAQGIAQFMPETARLEGLGDSFNPAESLAVSAGYLSRLADDYGNLGLAAAAYNGGRARVERFISGAGGLAPETRAYVHAITGYSADEWRDAPPGALDLTLEGEGGFADRCVALAGTRGGRPAEAAPPLPPWGIIIASNRSRDAAARHAERLKNRDAAVLKGERVYLSRSRRPGMARTMYFAQLGRDSRAEADALCARLRARGGDCMVLRN